MDRVNSAFVDQFAPSARRCGQLPLDRHIGARSSQAPAVFSIAELPRGTQIQIDEALFGPARHGACGISCEVGVSEGLSNGCAQLFGSAIRAWEEEWPWSEGGAGLDGSGKATRKAK